MGKRNRKGKDNNAVRNSFLKVENIKDANPELDVTSLTHPKIEEKESSSTINIPLNITKHENSKLDSIVFDYPTIGDLVSSVEKLCILNELETAFPEIENALIKAILIASQGVLEPAFNSLLYYSNPEENTDFALPMKPINVQDLSKIDVPEIFRHEFLDDIENGVSGQEINESVTISKMGLEQSSLVDPTNITNIPRSDREVAESTRNVTIAEGHIPISSREKSVVNGEEKGVNSLKGAAVKAATKSLRRKRVPVAVKREEPSNNLFDILNCDDNEEEEEQKTETDVSSQGKKGQSGNVDAVKASKMVENIQCGGATTPTAGKETSKIKEDGGYKSAFGTDSCGLFAADAKGAN